MTDLEPGLVYDLPRLEETWGVVQWSREINTKRVRSISRTLAMIGLQRSFETRRSNDEIIQSLHSRAPDMSRHIVENNLLFFQRLWTMPDRVLMVVANIDKELPQL